MTKTLLLGSSADLLNAQAAHQRLAFVRAAVYLSGLQLASAGGEALSAEIKAELKTNVDKVMTAFEAFKEANDARLKEIATKGAADPIIVDKLAKIEKTLDGAEGLNQKVTLAEKQAKALEEQMGAMKALLEKIETKAGRPARTDGEKAIDLKKNVRNWGEGIFRKLTDQEPSEDQRKALADVAAQYKALNVSTDSAGGYLAPAEFVAEIIKAIVLVSPARAIARVRSTANKSIIVPKRTGTFAARRTAEGATRTETTGLTYGTEEIPAPEIYALVDISNEMLEDAAFDMEAEIRGEASEQFAVKEGTEFVTGTGIGECEGITTNTDVTGAATVSGSAAVIADANGVADGIINVWAALKSGYAANATWIMNRSVLAAVRKLKDSNKNYIWVPGVAGSVANTILGSPYVEFPDMPNEGANTYPIAYGDFRRAYTIVDRIAMSMLRDPYTQATSGNVRFQFRRRMGGQVVLSEAIKLLKCST